MRFRLTWAPVSSLWIAFAVIQIALIVGRRSDHMERHRHGLIIADDLALGLYVLLILFWLWTALRSYLELTDSALRVRGGFRTKDIPYNAIAGIRKPSQGPHRMNRKSIELEIARLGPETYPHEYLRFAVADRVALAREIHTRAPEAVYEF